MQLRRRWEKDKDAVNPRRIGRISNPHDDDRLSENGLAIILFKRRRMGRVPRGERNPGAGWGGGRRRRGGGRKALRGRGEGCLKNEK